MPKPEKPTDNPNQGIGLRVRATVAERAFLKEVTGDNISGFMRDAIKHELELRGIEIPEGFFFERPAGNWTKGETRRGKEKPPAVAMTNALAV